MRELLAMHVISRKRLREFWEEFPETKEPLAAWFRVAESADWEKWSDVTATYPRASLFKCCIIFNILGNNYRLVVRRAENWKTLFVVGVYTHAEYDRNSWRGSCECR